METNKRLHPVVLTSTFLILLVALVSSTASAATVQNNWSIINETRITNSGEAWNPNIYGDKIVWENWHNEKGDIYMYNLSTKKETLIPTHGLISGSSAIYGNRIIWMDKNDDDGKWNIYVYDTSTHSETQISADGSYHKRERKHED